MISDINAFMSKCDIYQSHRTFQKKETLQQYEIISRTWAKVATDLCDMNRCNLLVVIVILYESATVTHTAIVTLTATESKQSQYLKISQYQIVNEMRALNNLKQTRRSNGVAFQNMVSSLNFTI